MKQLGNSSPHHPPQHPGIGNSTFHHLHRDKILHTSTSRRHHHTPPITPKTIHLRHQAHRPIKLTGPQVMSHKTRAQHPKSPHRSSSPNHHHATKIQNLQSMKTRNRQWSPSLRLPQSRLPTPQPYPYLQNQHTPASQPASHSTAVANLPTSPSRFPLPDPQLQLLPSTLASHPLPPNFRRT